MTKLIKSTKTCAGAYTVTLAGETNAFRSVDVVSYSKARGDTFTGWIARANWDSYTYSDPLQTKAEAMHAATEILEAEIAFPTLAD